MLLTRFIYPLSLREHISFKFYKLFSNTSDKNISLEFDDTIKLDLLKTDIGHKSIIFNGFFELPLSRDIVKYGLSGGLLVDVGANYGYFSCLWASKNPNNRVVAFEASPNNVGPLKNNINKNGFQDKISVIEKAVGKEKGKLNFNLGNENQQTGWGGLTIKNEASSISVDVDTLDNYFADSDIKQINVLKIDTEGADTWVLYGAEKLLRKKRIDHIFFEHNDSRMRPLNIGKNEAIVFLEGLDYIVEKHTEEDFYAYPRK